MASGANRGTRATPASSGERPCVDCRNSVRTNKRAEHAQVHRRGVRIGDRELAAAEEGQRQHRPVAPAALDEDERHRQHDRRSRRRDHGRRAGPGAPGLDEGERRRHQQQDAQDDPGAVEPSVPGVDALAYQARSHDQRHRDDRHVDEEDGAPAEGVDQQPADERAGRQRETADGRPDADRPRLRARLGERTADDRQRPGQQQRGADALGEAGPHQHARARRDAAQEGAGPEDAQADEDDPAVAVQVAHRPAREHERGERERVSVDDPLKPADAGIEAGADLGRRDIDDRHVEQDEEVPHAHDDEHGAR